MPAGFRARDEAGNITFDSNKTPLKVLGYFDIGSGSSYGTANGSFTDSRLADYPSHTAISFAIDGNWLDDNLAVVTISGTLVSWVWPTPSRSFQRMVYGIF